MPTKESAVFVTWIVLSIVLLTISSATADDHFVIYKTESGQIYDQLEKTIAWKQVVIGGIALVVLSGILMVSLSRQHAR